MPKLNSLSFHEFIKKLKKFGFKGPYSGGRHLYMIKDSLRLTLPNLHRKGISVALLIKIIDSHAFTDVVLTLTDYRLSRLAGNWLSSPTFTDGEFPLN